MDNKEDFLILYACMKDCYKNGIITVDELLQILDDYLEVKNEN
jgi:hypothetical protein